MTVRERKELAYRKKLEITLKWRKQNKEKMREYHRNYYREKRSVKSEAVKKEDKKVKWLIHKIIVKMEEERKYAV